MPVLWVWPITRKAIPLSTENLDTHADIDAEDGCEPFGMSDIAPDALKAMILTSLDDDQAEDVVCIDLAGKSSLADAIIVASGRSQRHVAAIADHILRKIKDSGAGRARVEGLPNADWVLIDAGDIVAHIFRPEVRAFYAIERIWTGETRHAAGAA
jgi:ribosome-associated protein